MNYKLIKIDGYRIIVSNEEIKSGDLFTPIINRNKDIIMKASVYSEGIGSDDYKVAPYNQNEIVKILYSQNPKHALPTITFSDEVAKELGIVDIHKKAVNYCNSHYKQQDWEENYENYYIGYNQALSDNKDKLFTLENMRKCYGAGENSKEDEINGDGETSFDEFIQSLTKQEWDVELEMEDCGELNCISTCSSKCQYPHLKITNNSVKVIKLLK